MRISNQMTFDPAKGLFPIRAALMEIPCDRL